MAVSDLTNTTWVINSTTCTAGYGVFNVEAQTSIEGNQWNTLYIGYKFGQGETYTQANSIVWLPFVAYPSGEFTITGGTDVTNANLIAWLEANATHVVETGKTQLGTRAITKKMFGTREITKEVVNGVVVYEASSGSGYTLTLSGQKEYSDTNKTTYVKVNSAPTSSSDYTAYVKPTGEFILNTGVVNPVPNVTKVYLWGGYYQLNNGEMIYLNTHNSYDTALELTITQNSTLKIYSEVD